MQEYAVKTAVENILASASKSNKNSVQGHEADVKECIDKSTPDSCKDMEKIRC